jgi:nucleoside-triphosphatase
MLGSGKKILITGLPGVGKTTLIRKIFELSKSCRPAGFYTAEIREGGIRKGFELIDFTGSNFRFAHVDIKSRYRVGKYRIDLNAFEEYLDSRDFLNSEYQLIIIDEIGKMECYSEKFIALIDKLLSSDNTILATIALKGGGVIERIKRRDDILLYEITQYNRDQLPIQILDKLSG